MTAMRARGGVALWGAEAPAGAKVTALRVASAWLSVVCAGRLIGAFLTRSVSPCAATLPSTKWSTSRRILSARRGSRSCMAAK